MAKQKHKCLYTHMNSNKTLSDWDIPGLIINHYLPVKSK